MPIPPRPIPHSNYRRRAARPSPPLPSSARRDAFIAESRAEMALLPGLTVGSTPNSLRGVRLMHAHAVSGSAPTSRPTTPGTPGTPRTPPTTASSSPQTEAPTRHEVPLTSLMDGRGRPKRVGAASALGFDFVPRPAVVALADDAVPLPPLTAPRPVEVPPLFWPWRGASTPASAAASPATSPPPAPPASLPRSGPDPAPATPALVPSHPDDDEDDDWEHVCAVEDDHIVGELELDDEHPLEVAKRNSYATVTAREAKMQ